jgi:hypothetical protein
MSQSNRAAYPHVRRRGLALALAGAAGLLLALAVVTAARAAPATPPPALVVNNAGDAPAAAPLNTGVCATARPGGHPNGVCTLRAAIMEANHWPGGGVTILFDPALMNTPISLSIPPQGPQDDEALGDLNISQTTHINGLAGGDYTTIDAHALGDRVFHVAPGAVVDIVGLLIQNGTAGSQGGAGVLVDSGAALYLDYSEVDNNTDSSGQGGGGVRSQGTLTLSQVSVEGNVSNGPGGGVANDGGVATIVASSLAVNQSGSWGGGLYNNGPRLSLVQSMVVSNTASNYGGGLAAGSGTTTITASTFLSNFTYLDGGAIEAFLTGHVNVVNSTLTANDAVDYGGGLEAEQSGVVSLYNATVSNNIADWFVAGNGKGGGLSIGGGGVVNLQNTLIAGNHASASPFGSLIVWPDDCFSAIHSNGYNLIQYVPNGACTITGNTATDQSSVDPLLGPLQYHGGATLTQALLPGSPAIDAANPAGCMGPAAAPLTTDQRGAPRTANGAGHTTCDIGAYEVQRLVYLSLVRR